MTLIPEPLPIHDETENQEFFYMQQLMTICNAARNLTLTSRSEGAITHGDKAGNLAARYVVYTSNGVANTQDTVAHGLGYAPSGYIVVKQDKSANVYTSAAADATNLYLKTSVATVAWILLVF